MGGRQGDSGRRWDMGNHNQTSNQKSKNKNIKCAPREQTVSLHSESEIPPGMEELIKL